MLLKFGIFFFFNMTSKFPKIPDVLRVFKYLLFNKTKYQYSFVNMFVLFLNVLKSPARKLSGRWLVLFCLFPLPTQCFL